MTDATQPSGQPARRSVTYQRPKTTSRRVLFMDKLADRIITFGGLFVILAVLAIMVFLIWVCIPLLGSGSLDSEASYKLEQHAGEDYAAAQVDEQMALAVDVALSGKVEAFHAPTGRAVPAPAFDLGGQAATTVGKTLQGGDIIFGFADGTMRIGTLALKQLVVAETAIPPDAQKLDDRDVLSGGNVFSKIPGQFRRTSVEIALEPPVQIAPAGTAIVEVDYRVAGTAERPLKTFVSLDAAGTIRLSQAASIVNMMTGETASDVTSTEIPTDVGAADVVALLLNADGSRVIVGLKDGTLLRFDTRDFKAPRLVERARAFEGGVTLTALAYLNGDNSLVVGGSDGSTSVWFGIDRQSKDTGDGIVLTKAHADFEPMPAAVTDIRVSQRTRMFLTADAGGNVWVRHATTERTLLQLPSTPDSNGLSATIFAPRDDAVLGIGRNGQVILWRIDIPHPETTLQSLFGKVWYEGRTQPEYVWQSTAGQDSFEPKLSLVPLIFGTFKAAIYALLLAVPIALFAAIYTSEFLHWKVRSVVKPVMELMATLPSVVIGFIAALVLSPIVENWIAAIVIAFGVVPITLIGAAFLWQILPKDLAIRLEGVPKLAFFFLVVLAGIWASVQIGPAFETAFFGGDFKLWTSGEGSGQPFLFLLLLPLSALGVFTAWTALDGVIGYRPWLRQQGDIGAGTIEFVRWALLIGVSLAVSWLFAGLLTAAGLDARGGIIDTYVQRNTLIAAFAISFALIPIIYTIAEDAMNTVPEHLRAGSLACGASKWQTARWIIVPTAGSGIFSAIMIGLGRAVGETMIVVMATGNTPVTDFNLFNGLRALSANINVELPEAVKDSTLYRTLFLCGLVLFALTFVINTVAEMVRQRFRKRAAQL
jgi:phosphate transport system permease protein